MGLIRWLRRLLLGVGRLFSKKTPLPPQPQHPSAIAQQKVPGTFLTFYTVFIPSLEGRFYYLSNEAYSPGEIVRIPFGYQDREYFGIVEQSQLFPYDKTPIPLWKMKYILGKAPEAVSEAYHHHKNLNE